MLPGTNPEISRKFLGDIIAVEESSNQEGDPVLSSQSDKDLTMVLVADNMSRSENSLDAAEENQKMRMSDQVRSRRVTQAGRTVSGRVVWS